MGGKDMAVNTDSIVSNLYSTYGTQSRTDSAKASKTTGTYGKTIGNAKLSEEGAKYYQELKSKYSNMDFILVSKDQKANAQANAASGLSQLKSQIESSGQSQNVVGYGMKVNDGGTASFFEV